MFSELFLILAPYSPLLIDGDMKEGPSGDEILNSLLFPLSSLTGLTLPPRTCQFKFVLLFGLPPQPLLRWPVALARDLSGFFKELGILLWR